jgi:hypothetical protein
MASNNEDSGPTLTNLAKQYQTSNQVSLDIENEEELFSQVPKKATEVFDYDETEETKTN